MTEHISWAKLNEGDVLKEVYTEDGLTDTWIEKKMNKNERITIKALQNGYLVERSWHVSTKADASEYDYRHMDEEFMFKTWDEVVEFVTQHKLDVPPAKI